MVSAQICNQANRRCNLNHGQHIRYQAVSTFSFNFSLHLQLNGRKVLIALKYDEEKGQTIAQKLLDTEKLIMLILNNSQ